VLGIVSTRAGRLLAVQVAELFSFSEAVELGRDDRSGALVGGPGELGVEPQGGGALGVAEAAGDGVQISARLRSWVAE
jgi:hypothetical protein